MSLSRDIDNRIKSLLSVLYDDQDESPCHTRSVPWDKINEIIQVSPQVIWNSTLIDMHRPVLAAIVTRNLEELKFLNDTIRANSSSVNLNDRLLFAFAYPQFRASESPLFMAVGGSLEIFRYLVEECCPGSNVLDDMAIALLQEAMGNDNVEVVDYILSNASRGLTLLDEGIRPFLLMNFWEYYIDDDLEVGGYLANVKMTFLERESTRAQNALEYLEPEGFELPALMLGVIRDNTNVLRYRMAAS